MINLITIMGATATGKTRLAAELASLIGGEIISADSRQVYRGMDIGTGKDLKEFKIGNYQVPYHLIDIVDPGYEYNVFEFQRDFGQAFSTIKNNGNIPVLCGGTGLYIESILKGYRFQFVPENSELRHELELLPQPQLIERLKSYGRLHNTTDLIDRKRLTRAIEINEFMISNPGREEKKTSLRSINFGIYFPREIIKERITERLRVRLEEGMINEVKNLLDNGLEPEQLTFYGLEYRYVTQFILGQTSFDEMFNKLNIAIHQFAKRQMTWFRKMEKNGIFIHWIDGNISTTEKLSQLMSYLPK